MESKKLNNIERGEKECPSEQLELAVLVMIMLMFRITGNLSPISVVRGDVKCLA